MAKKNDMVLASEIKSGDTQSFKIFYDRYHEQLYYLARRYLKNKSLAKDAVQDVFLKLWNKRKTIDLSSSIKAFLFTMLKNHVLNMIRKEKNRRKLVEELKKGDSDREARNTVAEEVAYSEYENHLQKALVQLSPAQQDVFKLRSLKGFSNKEVADKKNVSIHTVKTQYYLGSKFIRNYLKKHAGLFLLMLVLLLNG